MWFRRRCRQRCTPVGSIRSSLNRLEEALQAVGSPLVAHRPSPLDEAAVRDRIASLGWTAPQGLIDWYGWRNGDGGPIEPVQRIESSLLLGRAVAVTLDQASYMYRLLRDALRDTDTFGFEEG